MKQITLLFLFTCSFLQAQISFKHIATYNDNEFQNVRRGEFPVNCIIDNPLTNNNPDLILIVTVDFGVIGPRFNDAYSVFFFDNKWIINTPNPAGIPENTKFNILAVPRGTNAFVHTSRPTSSNNTTIDNPLLNGNPNAKFLITKASFRNTKEVGIAYAPTINKWTILNLDLSLFAVNSYNIVIDNTIFIASATTVSSNNFTINNSTTNDGTNNLVFTTPLFQGVANANATGVWFNANRWKIFNQNASIAMPVNAKYMVLSKGNPPFRNTDNEVHVFLNDINETLCPQTLTRGDREFNGNGPRIQTAITLEIRNTTEIWAIINFTATETVSDFSTVSQRFEKRVFTTPNNRRIAQILSPITTNINFISPSAGTQFIGATGTSNNTVTNTEPMNFIKRMAIVGDTGGDDISTDNDCTDDTRIENISFFPIKVQFQN
ncbi:hypothetical protein OX283_013885 [Flavobacterium sp. SUN052]|uniref:DUF7452 domain-containing protein n=1 Tax=Flavobacterium sp. SUN052 TaxID=3002441 RepID=UPI00237D4881|nr:hypothetical protein [Flavobacterium sp. SUN052]MEC4005757.1 hypothetical protein [Flavobacterium sp. SUN052]